MTPRESVCANARHGLGIERATKTTAPGTTGGQRTVVMDGEAHPVYFEYDPTSALIYMSLEESSGDLLDWTENDNDASRGTGVTRAEGQVGYGQQGDGSDKLGRTSLTLEQSSASSPGYTMMGWMYIPSGDDGGAVCSTSASNTWGWSLASRCDVDRWAIYTGAARSYIGDFVYDTWVHLAGVWDTDDDEVRRYRDGSLYGDALAIGYDAENQAMTIGSTANRPYEDLDGILDEVIVLESAWSADYIEVYYDMTSAPASWCQCGAEQPVDASGLGLLGLRYLSPRVGRFLTADWFGGINLYTYAGGRPIGMIDPTGLKYIGGMPFKGTYSPDNEEPQRSITLPAPQDRAECIPDDRSSYLVALGVIADAIRRGWWEAARAWHWWIADYGGHRKLNLEKLLRDNPEYRTKIYEEAERARDAADKLRLPPGTHTLISNEFGIQAPSSEDWKRAIGSWFGYGIAEVCVTGRRTTEMTLTLWRWDPFEFNCDDRHPPHRRPRTLGHLHTAGLATDYVNEVKERKTFVWPR